MFYVYVLYLTYFVLNCIPYIIEESLLIGVPSKTETPCPSALMRPPMPAATSPLRPRVSAAAGHFGMRQRPPAPWPVWSRLGRRGVPGLLDRPAGFLPDTYYRTARANLKLRTSSLTRLGVLALQRFMLSSCSRRDQHAHSHMDSGLVRRDPMVSHGRRLSKWTVSCTRAH